MEFLKLKFVISNLVVLGNIFNPLFLNFGITYAADSPQEILENYINRIPKDKFYIIGPGDFIRLEVSEMMPELTKVFSINGEGFSKLPRLKLIYTKGLTIQELTNILNKEYSKYVKKPDVNLTIVNYRPVKIFVDGEVSSPGMYILSGSLSRDEAPVPSFDNIALESSTAFATKKDSLRSFSKEFVDIQDQSMYFPTLIDVIRTSGGVLPFADLSKIKITRINNISNGGGKIATTVNLLKSINLEDSNQNIRIMDGDLIQITKSNTSNDREISKVFKSNINPKYVDVFIGGQVENPGIISISRATSFNEALALSGGRKVLTGKATFRRYNNDGSLDSRTFRVNTRAKRGSYKNPYLNNGDMIFVGKSKVNVAGEVLNTISSPFASLVTVGTAYKLFTGD